VSFCSSSLLEGQSFSPSLPDWVSTPHGHQAVRAVDTGGSLSLVASVVQAADSVVVASVVSAVEAAADLVAAAQAGVGDD
jgi:hypothetical protein